MQLTPRYGDDPIIRLDGPPEAIVAPLLRQRERLVATLAGFSADQWAHPSRCEGWTNRDVVVHLTSTDQFWRYSIEAGLKGDPTRFLATFDPVASPAELVAGAGDPPVEEVLDRFATTSQALTDRLATLDDAQLRLVAEAPPGHLPIATVAHHALWDCWIHERDILLPLGATAPVEPDEVAACLRYAAALSPAFAVEDGQAAGGTMSVEGRDPAVTFAVEVASSVSVRAGSAGGADLHLAGDAVELLEALSQRRPLDQAVPDSHAWMVHGLAQVFDLDPT